jgi:adenylate kinase
MSAPGPSSIGEAAKTLRLVFMGPPGAGKGTQAARVAQALGLRHASTGEMFRQAAARGAELGRQVRHHLDSGTLVPDDVTSEVVEELVVEHGGFVLDGYPRTLGQAHDLEGMLGRRGVTLDAVVYLTLPEDEAVRRLTGRLVCSRCGANFHEALMPPRREGECDECGGELTGRSDSAVDVVRERLRQYADKTLPLIAFYRDRGMLEEVDGRPSVEEVTRRTLAALERRAGLVQDHGAD